jgi:galactonate dehydratase
MKITAVKGFPFKVGHRNNYVVKIETDAGISGVGEGGISGRELAMQGALEHFARILIGMDPRRIEHIWQRLYRGHYFEGGKIIGATISAIDIALWDILGQALGVPVYQLLGGACRDRIRCFATPATLTGPECVETAREHVAAGWRQLRFTVGMAEPGWAATGDALYEPNESLDLAAHWIREVRRAIGTGPRLSIDFHHRLSVAEAAQFCQRIADVGLEFLEEPIRAQSPAAYRQLRAMTPIPFAIGEEFANKWEFLPFIEEGLTNFARIDVSNVGGFSEAKKVAGWAEAHYIDVMPHNPLGAVCTAASIHFCAALNNFAGLEYSHRNAAAIPRDVFPVAPQIEGDSFPLPTAPGLGITFNEEAVADHPFELWDAPHFRRRDGSFTNW